MSIIPPYNSVDAENDKFVLNSEGNVAIRTVLSDTGFNIPSYDDIALGYTDGNLTSVVYKKDSETVATLTLSYTDGNLTGVVRT